MTKILAKIIYKISGKKRAENLDAYKDKKLEKVYNYFFDKK